MSKMKVAELSSYCCLIGFSGALATFASLWAVSPETVTADSAYRLAILSAIFLALSLITLYFNKERRKMAALTTLLALPMALSFYLIYRIIDYAGADIHAYVVLVVSVLVTAIVYILLCRIGMFDKNATDASVFGKRAARY